MGYTEAIFAKNLNPVGAYFEILKAIEARYFPSPGFDPENHRRQLRAMSKGERAVVLTQNFFDRIYSCGFEQLFLEDGADLAQDTADGHELIGFPKAADIIRRAIQAAGIPNPIPPGYDYNSTEASEEQSAALKALTSEYYKSAEKNLEETVAEYVRNHPEEFN